MMIILEKVIFSDKKFEDKLVLLLFYMESLGTRFTV
jgi:hypothetical protein